MLTLPVAELTLLVKIVTDPPAAFANDPAIALLLMFCVPVAAMAILSEIKVTFPDVFKSRLAKLFAVIDRFSAAAVLLINC